jgi:hypothetical protein
MITPNTPKIYAHKVVVKTLLAMIKEMGALSVTNPKNSRRLDAAKPHDIL